MQTVGINEAMKAQIEEDMLILKSFVDGFAEA